MAVFTSLNGEPNNCSLTNSSLFIVYLLWWRMSIVSLAVLTLSSTNITWLLFVYIAKMLLSVHLHIILMRSLAALTHVIFQFLMHSLFLPQQHQLLHFLLFIIALYNSLQYFLSAYTLPFFTWPQFIPPSHITWIFDSITNSFASILSTQGYNTLQHFVYESNLLHFSIATTLSPYALIFYIIFQQYITSLQYQLSLVAKHIPHIVTLIKIVLCKRVI